MTLMHKDWRCQRYTPLGYMEFILKLIGIGAAFASVTSYTPDVKVVLFALKMAQVVFMGILGGTYLAWVVQRVFDKEVFALSFSVIHLLAHWLMTVAIIVAQDPSAYLFTYCFLMVLSEYVRLMFLFLAENAEVRFLTKPIMYGIAAGYIVIYIIIIGLQGGVWILYY
eukprot:TRINITY_DN5421_c0_g1_i1.p2 TRINITY_DN5421_c0_g1~~TRINITY_DN5421_c0_g1_i1.p2  ORF type:complete len:168 (-),score=57.06 TRINITY_DN5421_c0_g1_i1:175-678(-)